MSRPPIHFTRAASDTDLDKPVLGYSSARGYTHTFGSGKFSNAIYCPWDTTENPEIGGSIASPYYFGSELTVEAWIKLNGWGISGTGRTGSYPAWQNNMIFGRATNTFDNAADFYFSDEVGLRVDHSRVSDYLIWDEATILADTWYHFAWTRKDGGLFKLFQDGAEVASKIASGNISGLYQSGFCAGGVTNYGAYGSYLYCCNFKIYDYYKTDFSDRFNERGGMNDYAGAV